jgi:hypothetical protein
MSVSFDHDNGNGSKEARKEVINTVKCRLHDLGQPQCVAHKSEDIRGTSKVELTCTNKLCPWRIVIRGSIPARGVNTMVFKVVQWPQQGHLHSCGPSKTQGREEFTDMKHWPQQARDLLTTVYLNPENHFFRPTAGNAEVARGASNFLTSHGFDVTVAPHQVRECDCGCHTSVARHIFPNVPY